LRARGLLAVKKVERMADHQVAHANLVDGSFAGQLLLDRPGRKETGESVAVLGVPLAPAHESFMAGLGFLGQNGVEDVVEGYRLLVFHMSSPSAARISANAVAIQFWIWRAHLPKCVQSVGVSGLLSVMGQP
jgi:hypothetical protein